MCIRDRDYTFWGKGVRQGHSDAVRRIEGVKDARQYTIPVEMCIRDRDCLAYLDEIKVCTGYEIDGVVTKDFPVTAKLKKAKPVLEMCIRDSDLEI